MIDNTAVKIKQLIRDMRGLTSSETAFTPQPKKKAKTWEKSRSLPNNNVEEDELYALLLSMLGGSDQMTFLWYDTAQPWFKPWNSLKNARKYDTIASEKAATMTFDYVKAFCMKYNQMFPE